MLLLLSNLEVCSLACSFLLKQAPLAAAGWTVMARWPVRKKPVVTRQNKPQPMSARPCLVAGPAPGKTWKSSKVSALGRHRASSSRSIDTVRPQVDVPEGLRRHMAEWGPRLRRSMEEEARSVGASSDFMQANLAVGTDCSGLDAPILAIRAMGIPHKHTFSCEINAKTRQFIRANSPQAVVFEDMCRRDHATLPPHNLYVCGFPCKPFSSLRCKSRYLRDPQARPFFAMLRTLRQCLPALAVLENVPGLITVLDKVWQHLHALKWYEVLTFMLDPADMGEPVARPRFYFVLVRADVAVCRGEQLDEVAHRLAHVGLRRCTEPLTNRLLLTSSTEVQQWLERVRRRSASAASRGEKRCKWQSLHQAHAAASGQVDIEGLSDRTRSLLGIELARAGLSSVCPGFNVDLSQSLGRVRLRRDSCPTVTPGCLMLLGDLGRLMIPLEKCLVHLVPLHDLVLPSDLTDSDFAILGGNTMHLMSAGALERSMIDRVLGSGCPGSCCGW